MKGDYSVIDYSMQCGSLDVGVFVPAACSFAASSVVPAPVVAAFPFLSCGLGVGCGGLRGVLWSGAASFSHLLQRVMKDRFSQHGRSSHFLRVLVHMRMGEARLSGHNLGKRCWTLLSCGGLSLP